MPFAFPTLHIVYYKKKKRNTDKKAKDNYQIIKPPQSQKINK